MSKNKYEQLSNWMKNYPSIGSWLYFNVTNVDIDNVSLNSVQGARAIEKFADGSRECELLFAVEMIKAYDEGTADTNLEALEECEALTEWCEEQMEKGDLPTFDGCMVHEIEMLDSTPSLSVDPDTQLAKYQFQGKVKYLELKGV